MRSAAASYGRERYHCRTSSFGLTKWYLDCVDDRGEAFIGYWARLRWKALSISYSGVLTGGATREHVVSVEPPALDGDVLRWRDDGLRCEASLRRSAPAFATTLYDDSSGSVSWRCEMPSADAVVCIDGRELRGRGYAEVLELTIAPWKLPIDELRWGRFTGERSLAWIEWRGPHPLTLILVDGRKTAGSVEADSIRAGDCTLALDDPQVIRSAPLSEALRSVPFLQTIVPLRLLHTSEQKWCSRATLLSRGNVADRGWAIHEVVRFA